MARDRGVALFVAVAAAMVVSGLALSVARDTRTLVLIAANEGRAAEARAAAEAGIARLALVLAADAVGERADPRIGERMESVRPTLGAGGPVVTDARAYGLRYGAARLILSVQAEAGLFDLNLGEAAILARLARRLRLGEAQRLVTAVEAARAAQEGRIAWRLGDRAFDTVGDLARLPGVGPNAFRRLSPFLTVEGARRPDPLTAPEALFAVLDLEETERARLATARAAGRTVWAGAPASNPPSTSLEALPAYRLTVTARLEDGTTASATARVAIDPTRRPALRWLVRALPAAPPAKPSR